MNKTELIQKLDRKYNWVGNWKSTVFNQNQLNDIASGVIMQIAYHDHERKTYNLDELIEFAANQVNLNAINYL
tara:strand:- start:368 stop:586 length:219 start_codon:yes stop_codon:yes gene_type:complete